MLEIIVEIADVWTETGFNYESFCQRDRFSYIWADYFCLAGETWHFFAFLSFLSGSLLILLGVLAAPAVAIAEFFHRGRSLLSSARAAIVSATYSLLLLMPYVMSKSREKRNFKHIRIWIYIYIHLFWLFGSSIVWIYNLVNRNWVFYGDPQRTYPQGSGEVTITSIAIIVILSTCVYSFIYLWRKHRSEMVSSFSIAPFVFALAWLFLGFPECSYHWDNRRLDEPNSPTSYYYWALPLIFASLAWIGYTSIKLWRRKRGADVTDLPPRSTSPDAGRGDS